jgi:5-methylcytosine-specific restriction endonuclease McrA
VAEFRCCKCNETLSASQFYVSPSGKRDTRCRSCASAYKSEWARKAQKSCAHPAGCSKRTHGGRYCSMHAQRLRVAGDLGPAESSREERPDQCWIPGCTNPCRAKRLCVGHLSQLKFGVLWSQTKGIVVACGACGQDFVSNYHPYSGKSVYCSQECNNRSRSNAAAFERLFRTKWCEECNSLLPAGLRSDNRFCSGRCKYRWYCKNDSSYRERQRSYSRKQRAKPEHRVYWSEYLIRNRRYFAQYQRLRDKKMRERAVCGMPTAEQLEARLGSVCRHCGAPEVTADHRKPLKAGGLHVLSNLAPLCRSCNSSKNAQWPLGDEWLHLKPLVAGKLP